MIVVCDDLDTDFGRLRFKPKGGHGGHNGLRDIEAHLHSKNYPRLRIGINNSGGAGGGASKKPSGSSSSSSSSGRSDLDVPQFVLGKFSVAERAELPKIIDQAVHSIQRAAHFGIQNAMNSANAKS